jgi:hypothetical protein
MPRSKPGSNKKKQATPDTAGRITRFVTELDAALRKSEAERLAAVKKAFSSLPKELNISLIIGGKETSLKSIQNFLNKINEPPTPNQKKTFEKYVDYLPRYIQSICDTYKLQKPEAAQEESAAPTPPPPVATASTPNTTASEDFEQRIGDFLGDVHTHGMKFTPENIAKIQAINDEIKKFHENPYAFIDSNTAVSAEQMELRIASMQATIKDYQEFLKWQDPAQSIASLKDSILKLEANLSQLESLSIWRGEHKQLTDINISRQKEFLQEQIKIQKESLKYYEADQEVLKSLQGNQSINKGSDHHIMHVYNNNPGAGYQEQRERYQKALEKYYAIDGTTGQFSPHTIPADGTPSPAPFPNFTVPEAGQDSILNKSAAKRMKLYELYQQEKPIGKSIDQYATELDNLNLNDPTATSGFSPEKKQSIQEYQSIPKNRQQLATIYSPLDNPIAKVTYHTSVNGKDETLALKGFGQNKAYQLTAESSVTEVEYTNGARLLINSDGSVNLPRVQDNPHPETSEDEFAKHIVHQFETTQIPNPTINLANIGLYDMQNPEIAKARILSKIVHLYAVDKNGKVDEEKYKQIQGAILTGNSVEIKEVFVKPELAFLRGPKEIKARPDYKWYNPMTYRAPLDPHFKKAVGVAAAKSAEQIIRESQGDVSGVSRYNPSLVNPIKEQLLKNQLAQKQEKEKEQWFSSIRQYIPDIKVMDRFDSRQQQKVKESLVLISQATSDVYNKAKDPANNASDPMVLKVREAILQVKTSLKLDEKATESFLNRYREDTRQDSKYSPPTIPGGGGRT